MFSRDSHAHGKRGTWHPRSGALGRMRAGRPRSGDDDMQLIQLHDVRKTYTVGEVEVRALQSVSLSIDRGEYVALMGPSGSGKTTLMNTLGCLDRPTEGSYLLDGEEVVEMSGDQRARLRNRKI